MSCPTGRWYWCEHTTYSELDITTDPISFWRYSSPGSSSSLPLSSASVCVCVHVCVCVRLRLVDKNRIKGYLHHHHHCHFLRSLFLPYPAHQGPLVMAVVQTLSHGIPLAVWLDSRGGLATRDSLTHSVGREAHKVLPIGNTMMVLPSLPNAYQCFQVIKGGYSVPTQVNLLQRWTFLKDI